MMDLDSKIYVAGHRGLVGSAITRELAERGYSNVVTRTHDELDLLDATAVRHFFDQETPEYVFLAAAHVGGIMANSLYRADFIYRNIGIQHNVIGESFRHDVRKLLFLGSTCIYPRDAAQPLREEALLTAPLEYTNEPYAIAKIAGIKMCESFNLQYGTDYLSVMPTNLYGPHDNFHLTNGHVLPVLIRKVLLARALMLGDLAYLQRDLHQRPIDSPHPTTTAPEPNTMEACTALLTPYGITPSGLTLWGSGTPLREFMWSEDMAQACVYIMNHCTFSDLYDPADPEVRNQHINIGTGSELTIRALSELIAQACDYPVERIRFDATKPDGTPRKLTDPSRLHRLGWHHSVEIDEGVQRLVDWYRSSL